MSGDLIRFGQMPMRGGPEQALGLSRTRQAKAQHRRGLWLLTAVLAVALLIADAAYVAYQNAYPSIRTVNVTELVHQRRYYIGRQVRVSGILTRGTLVSSERCEYRFLLEDHGATIAVHLILCVDADSFRHQLHSDFQLTLQGSVQTDGHFEAEVMFERTPGPYLIQRPAQASRSDLPNGLDDAGGGLPDSARSD
jgi:cytochrome c-type biogenesis protein CcmE